MNGQKDWQSDRRSRDAQIRTIVVGDEDDYLENTTHALSEDTRVEIVGCCLSGRLALKQVEMLQPDLVLVDLDTPDINGLETAHRIKERPEPPRVVILSSHDDPEFRAAASSVGADGFITKGQFGPQTLPLILSWFVPISISS